MTLYELSKTWTKEEHAAALAAMSPGKKAELLRDARAAGYSLRDARAAGYSLRDARAAGYSLSDARAAGYSLRDARAAGYSLRDARAAGYSLRDALAAEDAAKLDIQKKAKAMGRHESDFVLSTIRRGLLNGQSYGTIQSCGCFLGSAAKSQGKTVEEFCAATGIKKDTSSPAEEWFLAVGVGDTPENSYAAKKAAEWIEDAWASEVEAAK